MLGKGLGLLATIPFFYALAAISNIALRAFGFGLSGYAARLALFWALPAWLAARFGRVGLLVPLLTGLVFGRFVLGMQSVLLPIHQVIEDIHR